MNWKNRLTNYNFWISIFSAVILILQALKIEFDFVYINEIFTAVLGLLVVIGIINDPTRTTVKTTSETTNKTETEQTNLPTNEENEADNINNQNDKQTTLENIDIQTVLNKISVDLDEKIKELEKFNKEAISKLNLEQIEAKPETEQVENTAQNEMSNPYVDVIN